MLTTETPSVRGRFIEGLSAGGEVADGARDEHFALETRFGAVNLYGRP